MQNGVSKDIENLTQGQELTANQRLEELLKKNLELTEEVYKMTKKIKGHMVLQKIFSLIYLLIIVVPIILGLIYLPPLLKNMVGPYMELLNEGSAGGINLDNIDLSNVDIGELQKFLK